MYEEGEIVSHEGAWLKMVLKQQHIIIPQRTGKNDKYFVMAYTNKYIFNIFKREIYPWPGWKT